MEKNAISGGGSNRVHENTTDLLAIQNKLIGMTNNAISHRNTRPKQLGTYFD